MADKPTVAEGVAEALAELGVGTEGQEAANSWDTDPDFGKDATTPAAAGDEEASTDEGSEEPEATEDGETVTVEIPDFYKDLGLEHLPAEQAKAILDRAQQQDSYISMLQARLAAKPDEPVADDTPAGEPEEVTDQALAAALGYDPEDQFNQPTAAELKLARTVLALEDQVESMSQHTAAEEAKTHWNSSLDELEATYGKLPFERIQVLKYAVEEGVASPFETYFRLSAPAKREVTTAVAEARKAAAKKAEAGGVRPRATGGDTPVIDPSKVTLREATKLAMLEAEKETGLRFKNIFGSKKFKSGEGAE